jgi:hypothetical protein
MPDGLLRVSDSELSTDLLEERSVRAFADRSQTNS